MAPRFRPGDPALFRFIWPGKVFWALPGTTVEETADRVALWIAPESPFKRPPVIPVPVPRVAALDWTHSDERWLGGGVLMLHERGAAHSIWPRWDEDGDFGGWYVNLEEPWQESPFGFDTTDHALDVVVAPDRSWHWKDEDDLAEAVDVGLFSRAQADAIRTEGERASSHESKRARGPSTRTGAAGVPTRLGRVSRFRQGGTRSSGLRGDGARDRRRRSRRSACATARRSTSRATPCRPPRQEPASRRRAPLRRRGAR